MLDLYITLNIQQRIRLERDDMGTNHKKKVYDWN